MKISISYKFRSKNQKLAQTTHKIIRASTKTLPNPPPISNWAQLKLASLARSAAKRSESVFSVLTRFLCFRNTKRRKLGSYDAAHAFLLVLPFLCRYFLLILLICAVLSIFAVLFVLFLASPCSCVFCVIALLSFAAALPLCAALGLLCAA